MKPLREQSMRPNVSLYSPAAREKLPSPEWEGQTINLSVHPSTEPGQLHQLEFDGRGLGVDIPYEFNNRTGTTVYLVNCRRAFFIQLERLSASQWVTVWSPDIQLCLSQPITIERGSVYADTLHVWGAAPGTNTGPQFDLADPSGTYRIVWVDAVSSYQDHSVGPQIPHEFRVSNQFRLTVR